MILQRCISVFGALLHQAAQNTLKIPSGYKENVISVPNKSEPAVGRFPE